MSYKTLLLLMGIYSQVPGIKAIIFTTVCAMLLILTILMEMLLVYLIVVLICISLLTNNMHFFMCLPFMFSL
jgi:hypothetical protein